MRVLNKTNLNTKLLKAFIRAVGINEQLSLADINKLQVRVIYRKRSNSWKDDYATGYAYYNSSHMCLKVVRGVMPDKVALAKTTAHELAHTQGVHHRAMRNSIYGWKQGWREHWAWADKLSLTMNATEEEKKPDKGQVLSSKLSHCEKMVVLWERKVRLARTKQKKWEQKLGYYQRCMKKAATPVPEVKELVGSIMENVTTGKPIEVPEAMKEST